MSKPGMSLSDYTILVEKARRVRTVWALAQDFGRERGFDKLSYHGISPEGLDPHRSCETTVAAAGFPEDWVNHYVAEGLSLIDPIPQHALTCTRPFRWSEIGLIRPLIPREKGFMKLVGEAGLGDGFAFQAFGPNLRTAYVGLGLARADTVVSAECLRELQAAIQLTHLAVCRILDERAGLEGARLSPRETEVLKLISYGLSNPAIAQELGVSNHTVDALIRRLFSKLDVSDRTSAVLRAMTAGFLQVRYTVPIAPILATKRA